jgi:colanic acid/amylovoran biosynthesis glycosyltransferase
MERAPLEVLHSTLSWLPVTENWLYTQVRNLPVLVKSHIVCQETENLELFPVDRVYCVADAPKWRIYWSDHVRKLGIRRHLWLLDRASRQTRARILHSHFGNMGWANLPVAQKRRLKHVVTFYGYDVQYLPRSAPLWRLRYEELFESVDRVLCEGNHMKDRIVELGCAPEKVLVQHLGIDIDAIPFRPRVWNSDSPLRVLIAGTFKEKKGIPYAIEAIGGLGAKVPLEITLIGDANERAADSMEEKQAILDSIRRHKLESSIRLLGFQPHSRLLKEAYEHHVFVSPSVTAASGDTEGGAPVSIIEMAASGMPVVSTLHCDIPEVLKGPMTTLLAPERDVAALTAKLSWLIENQRGWYALSQAAREHLESEYDSRKQGDKLGRIYRDLVS